MSRYTKSVLAAAILASASAVGYAATSATSLENDALAIRSRRPLRRPSNMSTARRFTPSTKIPKVAGPTMWK